MLERPTVAKKHVGSRFPSLIIILFLLFLLLLFMKLYPIESIEDEESREYYIMGVAAFFILLAAILSEITGVTTAILETLFGVMASLFGLKPTPMLVTLGEIGGVILMFAAGTEVEVHVLKRYWRQSSLIGILSFFVPFLTTMLFFTFFTDYGHYPSLYIAVALSTTSVGVVYSALKPSGLLKSRKGQAIFASAMIIDVISILVLSLLVVKFSILILVYVMLLIVLPYISLQVLSRLPLGKSETGIRLIMALLLAMTLFSRIVGIHAVLFSFIVGIAVSGVIRSRGTLDDKIKGLTFGFLAPFFFFVAGLRISVENVDAFLMLIPLILLVSYIPKILATHFTVGKLLNIRSIRVSSIFGARLTVSVISATIGLTTGILSPEIYGAIVFTAVLTIIFTGIFAGSRLAVIGQEEI